MQIVIPLFFLLLIQVYIFYKIHRHFLQFSIKQKTQRYIKWMVAALFFYLSVTIIYMVGGELPTGPLPSVVVYGISYPFWIWILPSNVIIFPFFLLKDVILIVERWRAQRKHKQQNIEPPAAKETVFTRRRFLHLATTGAIVGPVTFSLYGTALSAKKYEINRVPIKIPNLSSDLTGFRIIQVSDVHSNLYMDRSSMDEIVALVNDLPADMIVLTGDYVTGTESYIYPFAESFKNLQNTPYGTFAIMGNHDIWTDPEVIEEVLEGIDISVLRNITRVIPVKNALLNLIGIDYGGIKGGSMRYRDRPVKQSPISELLDQAMESRHTDGFDLLLSHNPLGFNYAITKGIMVTLAGHTHGGQLIINLPGFRWSPASIRYPYIDGMYRIGPHHLYVNRGCGTTGPPIRINCPPEITLFTLENGKSDGIDLQ